MATDIPHCFQFADAPRQTFFKFNFGEGGGEILQKKSCFFTNFGNAYLQFARIHTSSLIKIEKNFNRPSTKYYKGDNVNVIVTEVRLTKMRPTSFHKKHDLL